MTHSRAKVAWLIRNALSDTPEIEDRIGDFLLSNTVWEAMKTQVLDELPHNAPWGHVFDVRVLIWHNNRAELVYRLEPVVKPGRSGKSLADIRHITTLPQEFKTLYLNNRLIDKVADWDAHGRAGPGSVFYILETDIISRIDTPAEPLRLITTDLLAKLYPGKDIAGCLDIFSKASSFGMVSSGMELVDIFPMDPVPDGELNRDLITAVWDLHHKPVASHRCKITVFTKDRHLSIEESAKIASGDMRTETLVSILGAIPYLDAVHYSALMDALGAIVDQSIVVDARHPHYVTYYTS